MEKNEGKPSQEGGQELRDAGYLVLFWEFFKLGIMTIGGGMAMIPQMQAIMVEKNHWVSEDDIIDCIAVSQSLPGVIAINMATYIGFEKRKLKGAIAATIGVLLPSLIIIIAVTELLHGIGGNPYVKGALIGIKAAATGLIGWSAYTIARRVVKNWFAAALAVAGFVLITFFNVNAVWVILGSIAIGLLYSRVTEKKAPAAEAADDGGNSAGAETETEKPAADAAQETASAEEAGPDTDAEKHAETAEDNPEQTAAGREEN